MTRNKKILIWAAITAAVVFLTAASIVLLAPRVINLDAIKNAIETGISKELGGTITYARADLTLFPRPGVAVRNLQITIPGALTGSIDTLEIHPSILPLFQRRFEISRITVDHPDLSIDLAPVSDQNEQKAETAPQTAQQTIESVLSIAASRMPDVTFLARSGTVTTRQQGKVLRVFQNITSKLVFQVDRTTTEIRSLPGTGTVPRPFLLVGSAACSIVDQELFPGTLNISIGRFEARPDSFTIAKARAQVGDLSAAFSGTLNGYLTTVRSAKLSISGTAGGNAIGWIRDAALLPPELTIHAPFEVAKALVHWQSTGMLQIQGNASVQGGTTLAFDLTHDHDVLRIRELRIRDRESNAALSLESDDRTLALRFNGNLAQSTLNRLFEHESFRFGWIKGDFRALVRYDDPLRSTAEGSLAGEDLVVPFVLKVPFTIKTLSLRAEGRQITVDPALLSMGKSVVAAQGTVSIRDSGLVLNLDLSTDGMEWEVLRELLIPYEQQGKRPVPLNVLGSISLRAGFLDTEHYQVKTVDADIALDEGLVKLQLNKASVCGISLPGSVVMTPNETRIDLQPSAAGPDLNTDLACLTGGRVRISGSYVFLGKISAQGAKSDLLKSLRGTLLLTARNGRIFHDFVFIRTIAYLNVTDLLRGSYDNIERDGAPFESFTAHADIKNGAMTFRETVLKSSVMNIVGKGVIDLPGWTIDVTLLAAPFTTVDAVVRHIPLVGQILGGNLISIPIRIHGPLDDPAVTTLPVSSIGEGLLGMMKRTLTLPFTLIEPIIPKGKKKTENDLPK